MAHLLALPEASAEQSREAERAQNRVAKPSERRNEAALLVYSTQSKAESKTAHRNENALPRSKSFRALLRDSARGKRRIANCSAACVTTRTGLSLIKILEFNLS